ncbi:protein SRG1-like [Argentina anserina]|uniref:protein SRG1-like n=1 Tax=Argentina anserina TaxID=57926 RepID=UPI0021766CE9|nr:protein SRG1-like [Potentilla anserina]
MEKSSDSSYFHEASYVEETGQLRTTRVPVVQELARQGLNHLPQRFVVVQPERHHEKPAPLSSHRVSEPLLSINMAKLRGNDRDEELAKLLRGAKTWGMVVLEGHGVAESVLNGVRDVVKEFFGLSFEEKKASVGSYVSVDNMGYGRNFVKSEEQPLDWIDRVTMKAAPAGATEGLHVWPQRPSNFRHVIEQYVAEARHIFNDILEALAEAISLERHVFLRNFDPHESEINVRVNYYPPCPRPDQALGLTPHTDASALTLLLQFEAGRGLQVLRDTKWVTVPWPKEAMLVNVGDLLEIMSNGMCKSPWHRVVTQMDVERFSVALFYNPSPQTEIEPIGIRALANEDDVEAYKKVVVGEYLQHFYSISPTVKKQAISFAKRVPGS